MKRKISAILIFILLNASLSAQTLFEEATNSEAISDSENSEKLELNGYIRGLFFAGKVQNKKESEMKTGYGEISFKFKADKGNFGGAFSELRVSSGYKSSQSFTNIDLREAYTYFYAGLLDLKIGKQIIVWGRADGINPTNNITPYSLFVFTTEEDDRRIGNFIVNSTINFESLKIEAIWLPFYTASEYDIEGFEFEKHYPDFNLKESGFALKFDLTFPSFDGSVSYFNGYATTPGIDATQDSFGLNLNLKPSRSHVFGMDFSATPDGVIGLRGEAAFSLPYKNYEENLYVFNPFIKYIIGADKEFGDFNLIVQYIGTYVFDYEENSINNPYYDVENLNRLIFYQTDKTTYSISLRGELKLLYETLKMEVFTMYNFTTTELMLVPKISYNVTDAFTISTGGRIFIGKENSLYDKIDSSLSGIFVQIKTSY